MLIFLDFEASSLSRQSYPIEVAWVFEDGAPEAHLIRPAPGWDEWDPRAEAIHHIRREQLEAEGEPHEQVASRMLAALDGHDVRASAPSWDGKWLSTLLRAAGLPRHALRLRDSDDAFVETAADILRDVVAPDQLAETAGDLVALLELRGQHRPPAHRALADAQQERGCWLEVRAAATRLAEKLAAEKATAHIS
jgi:hypothetical protein